MTVELEPFRTLAERFKAAVDSEDYPSAELALQQLDQQIQRLPSDWQQNASLVSVLQEIQQTLARYQQQLNTERNDVKEQVDKLGKSKKGVRAYIKK